MNTFTDIIALWPSHRAMAADIGAGHWQVAKWSQRDNIPPEWWTVIVERAPAAGLTVDRLAQIAAAKRAPSAA